MSFSDGLVLRVIRDTNDFTHSALYGRTDERIDGQMNGGTDGHSFKDSKTRLQRIFRNIRKQIWTRLEYNIQKERIYNNHVARGGCKV